MLLIGKLFFAAMGRVAVPEARRTPFNWYIDEFQNFTTDTLAHLLSESRKFGIRLTLANQNLAQLNQVHGRENLMEAVLGNVGNLCFFRMGAADAEKLATYTRPELDAQDLQYLPDFHAATRLLRNNEPMRPFVLQTLPKQKRTSAGQPEASPGRRILKNSRRCHARPVAEVEAEIRKRASLPQGDSFGRDKPSEEDIIRLVQANLDAFDDGNEPVRKEPIVGLDDMWLMTHAELLELCIARCELFTLHIQQNLLAMGVTTLGELAGHTEQALRDGGIGRKGIAKIRDVLGAVLGCGLAGDAPA